MPGRRAPEGGPGQPLPRPPREASTEDTRVTGPAGASNLQMGIRQPGRTDTGNVQPRPRGRPTAGVRLPRTSGRGSDSRGRLPEMQKTNGKDQRQDETSGPGHPNTELAGILQKEISEGGQERCQGHHTEASGSRGRVSQAGWAHTPPPAGSRSRIHMGVRSQGHRQDRPPTQQGGPQSSVQTGSRLGPEGSQRSPRSPALPSTAPRTHSGAGTAEQGQRGRRGRGLTAGARRRGGQPW